VTSPTATDLAEQMPGPAQPSRSRWPWIVAAVVGGLAVIYLALVAGTGDGLPRGTTVAGIDVGGMSEAQAVATLEKSLKAAATAPMVVIVDSDKVNVVPAASGLSFDAKATVDGLSGRVWNPITLLSQFTGGPTLDPVVNVDQAELDATVAGIASDADHPAVEPSILVKAGVPTLVPGSTGAVVDQMAASAAIAAAYLRSTAPVTLPLVESSPTVTDGAARDALTLATTAVSAPVTVKVDTITASIPPATIANALSFSAKEGRFTPKLDGDVLRAAIAPKLTGVETPGRDATWNVSSGKPVVVASRVGRGVNPDLLATDVLAVIAKPDAASRTVSAQVGAIPPKLTTEQAKSLGVTEQLSSFRQHFPYAAYRVQNIGQAARSINGTLLLPGEVFSLNKTLGERTAANGYTKGFVIGPGGVFKEDLGGGVSTSATATWTAAFYAGLQRIHTQAHSIWIPRYRAGLEATVAWGSFDMSFKNDTPHAVYITTIMKNTSITVQMWGTKVYDDIQAVSGPRYDISPPGKTLYDTTATCHAQTGIEGFSIDVYRVFIKGGAEIKREKITTRYRSSPTVICHADPALATPTPSPSASVSGKPTGSPKPTPTPSKT
jgi:vancomycin resistance protein YoaR